MIKIISNNPQIVNNYENVIAVEGGYMDVLKVVRDYIHLGYKLVTHPLAGSVKPNSSPYRSVIVKPTGLLDHSSLTSIERAIELARKMLSDKGLKDWDDNIKKDFQFVDKSLIDSALQSLRNQ